jgi:hypothetical protein
MYKAQPVLLWQYSGALAGELHRIEFIDRAVPSAPASGMAEFCVKCG